VLLLTLLALAIIVPSAWRAGDSAADILRSLDRAPAAAPSTNISRTEAGRGALGATDTAAVSGVAERMAAQYISDYVDPEIKEALARLPENERSALIARFDAFKVQLRRAIIDYEKVEVTLEKAEAILRADNNIKPELIAYFMERAAAYKTRFSDPAEVARLAFVDMLERRDGRLRPPPEHVVDDYFREGVYRSEQHNDLTEEQRAQAAAGAGLKPGDINKITMLDYLLKAGAPGGLKFASYGRLRHEIFSSLTSQE